MDVGWTGACCCPDPPPCEESLDPVLLSEEVAISARDHSLGLGAGFGSRTGLQESLCSLGLDVRSGSETLSVPSGAGPGMWGGLTSPESLQSGSVKPRSPSSLYVRPQESPTEGGPRPAAHSRRGQVSDIN